MDTLQIIINSTEWNPPNWAIIIFIIFVIIGSIIAFGCVSSAAKNGRQGW